MDGNTLVERERILQHDLLLVVLKDCGLPHLVHCPLSWPHFSTRSWHAVVSNEYTRRSGRPMRTRPTFSLRPPPLSSKFAQTHCLANFIISTFTLCILCTNSKFTLRRLQGRPHGLIDINFEASVSSWTASFVDMTATPIN